MHQKNVDHYWFFKYLGFKFEEHFCNKCHDLLTMTYRLENIVILNPKGATFRCILWGIFRNKGLRRLSNSVLEDKGVLWMDFSPNKKPIEVIKEGATGGTHFRDNNSGATGKWYKKPWKEFDQLKHIDQRYYCSNYYDVSVNKYGVKWGKIRVGKIRFGLMR